MLKKYLPWNSRQNFLLPPSLQEWLPEGHLARFILDAVVDLDISEITNHYDRQRRGSPPHHPRMMLALLLYAYCVGVFSSRKIEKRTYEDVAFRVITGNTHPDYTCISEFRRIHLGALSGLFAQVLQLCRKAGMIKLGVVALDGTKIKANASKHKAMSYERMNEEEQRLKAKVAELLKEAEAADVAEDVEHGRNRRGDELPEDLRHAQGRLAKIRALRAELEAEAQAQARQATVAASEEAQAEAAVVEMNNIREAQRKADSDDDDEPRPEPGAGSSPEPLPLNQVPTDKDGNIEAKAQRNFTDADSRIMKTGDGYIQGYNGHIVVDEEHQIIVAQGLSNQAPDAQYFVPMIDRTIANCEAVPDKVLGDAGFFSEDNVERARCRGIDPYVAPERLRRHAADAAPAEPDDGTSAKAWMKKKLSTPEGARVYSRRKVIVEPVFGQIKNRGVRQFLLRGLAKVQGEWTLLTLTHNLLKLFMHGRVAA